MASNKPTSILLSMTDITREEAEALSDAQAWALIYLAKSGVTKEDVQALSESEAWALVKATRAKKAQDNRLEICFTGFSLSKKKELTDIAERYNIKVVSSVTKKLDFLCGGENAGPKKIEKAESQGVQFLTEAQFIRLVETGELPKPT
jgi:NAD-dependent DNA ligase